MYRPLCFSEMIWHFNKCSQNYCLLCFFVGRLLDRDQAGDDEALLDDEDEDGFLKAFKVIFYNIDSKGPYGYISNASCWWWFAQGLFASAL